MRRTYVLTARWILIVVALSATIAAVAGRIIAPGILHPARLAPERLEQAAEILRETKANRAKFDVQAPDGVGLRSWKIRAATPNGDWVLLFHGVSDNRTGVMSPAEFLLRHGYSVVAMDSRAHGESGGAMATYGWKERYDTVAITNALFAGENVRHLFALGVSMGAAIALQSAAVEPRIEAVVAEDPFANLREVAYDYSGLQLSPLLGKTLFRPAVMVAMHSIAKEGGFDPDDVSPEKAVAGRAFAVLLICGTADHRIPCRHAERIYQAARGPKQLWVVQGAGHAGALGRAPAEYERRVIDFFQNATGRTRDSLRAGGRVVTGAEIPQGNRERKEQHGHERNVANVFRTDRAAQEPHAGVERSEAKGNDPAEEELHGAAVDRQRITSEGDHIPHRWVHADAILEPERDSAENQED